MGGGRVSLRTQPVFGKDMRIRLKVLIQKALQCNQNVPRKSLAGLAASVMNQVAQIADKFLASPIGLEPVPDMGKRLIDNAEIRVRV